jgi:hypothetical protein
MIRSIGLLQLLVPRWRLVFLMRHLKVKFVDVTSGLLV